MTLRFRLTFWFTILLALVLIFFALIFHTFVSNTLYRQMETTLRSQAEQVVVILERSIDPARARLPAPIILSSQVYAQATTPLGIVFDFVGQLDGIGHAVAGGGSGAKSGRRGRPVRHTLRTTPGAGLQRAGVGTFRRVRRHGADRRVTDSH